MNDLLFFSKLIKDLLQSIDVKHSTKSEYTFFYTLFIVFFWDVDDDGIPQWNIMNLLYANEWLFKHSTKSECALFYTLFIALFWDVDDDDII